MKEEREIKCGWNACKYNLNMFCRRKKINLEHRVLKEKDISLICKMYIVNQKLSKFF
jgi:hypothetical protein